MPTSLSATVAAFPAAASRRRASASARTRSSSSSCARAAASSVRATSAALSSRAATAASCRRLASVAARSACSHAACASSRARCSRSSRRRRRSRSAADSVLVGSARSDSPTSRSFPRAGVGLAGFGGRGGCGGGRRSPSDESALPNPAYSRAAVSRPETTSRATAGSARAAVRVASSSCTTASPIFCPVGCASLRARATSERTSCRRCFDSSRRAGPSRDFSASRSPSPRATICPARSASSRTRRLTSQAETVGLRSSPMASASSRSLSARAALTAAARRETNSAGGPE